MRVLSKRLALHEKHKKLELARWIAKLTAWMPATPTNDALAISELRQAVERYRNYLAHNS
jgi:hypothetical protein